MLFAVVDGSGQFTLQIASLDDAIEESVFEQELARLEPLGQFDADGRFDGSWAGEADQRLGFGKDQVAQRGETGRDAAHGRIGQDGDEQTARLIEGSLSEIRAEAAKLLEPKTVTVRLSSGVVVKTEEDLDSYLGDLRVRAMNELGKGNPVMLK